jgi:chitinase
VIYLPSSVWDPSSGPIGCNGNDSCTFIIPPSPLPAPETITWPDITTTLLSSSGGSIYTKTTVLGVAPFTITEISYWSITVTVGDPVIATFTPEQSIMPPSFIITLPGTEAVFPPSKFPSYSNFLPVPATTSTSTPVPFFFSGSHGVTIQPQPTLFINTPTTTGTTTRKTAITYSSSSSGSQSTCTSDCGSYDCGIFGCGTGCGVFGCGGGCGIFGCGGGCGLLGCGGGCNTPGGCGSTNCPLTSKYFAHLLKDL